MHPPLSRVWPVSDLSVALGRKFIFIADKDVDGVGGGVAGIHAEAGVIVYVD